MSKKWYVVHTQTGLEDKVKAALEKTVAASLSKDLMGQIVIPTEQVSEVRGGKKRVSQRKFFPGYLLVEMELNESSYLLVKNTPGVTGFIGAGTLPIPVSPEEMKELQKRMGSGESKYKIEFVVGDPVKITDGPFKDFDGKVSAIDEERGKVKVLISMFGRETAVELDSLQIKKL